MADTIALLAGQWAHGLGPAISAMTGTSSQASTVQRDMPAHLPDAALVWRQELSAADGAIVWVWLPESIWLTIGKQVLQSAGLSEDGGAGDPAEARSTFVEVLQQSLAPISNWIGAQLGREVQIQAGQECDSIPSGLTWQAVAVHSETGDLGCGWLAASSELLGALPSANPPAESAPMPAPPPNVSVPTSRPSRTLDLLMEVELPVGVSFGRAQMRLKDAIKLTTGSIVELNRSVSEPVEIIVNNCVIARGEVVVVEGNYGVRIKEIISRDERLRTLF